MVHANLGVFQSVYISTEKSSLIFCYIVFCCFRLLDICMSEIVFDIFALDYFISVCVCMCVRIFFISIYISDCFLYICMFQIVFYIVLLDCFYICVCVQTDIVHYCSKKLLQFNQVILPTNLAVLRYANTSNLICYT